jgi:excisionase family DNA binding protein
MSARSRPSPTKERRSMNTYTIKEIASILKVHRNTVDSWIQSGKLRVMRERQVVRVTEEELNDFVESRTK